MRFDNAVNQLFCGLGEWAKIDNAASWSISKDRRYIVSPSGRKVSLDKNLSARNDWRVE